MSGFHPAFNAFFSIGRNLFIGTLMGVFVLTVRFKALSTCVFVAQFVLLVCAVCATGGFSRVHSVLYVVISHVPALWITLVIMCVAMAGKDILGTLMVISQNRKRRALSGLFDAGSTPINLIFYSYAGADLLHNYGWQGWPAMGAVMCVDFVATYFSTGWGDSIKSRSTVREEELAVEVETS